MPTVGGTKFPYTKEGMAKAKAWSEMTGKPMKMEKKYKQGGKVYFDPETGQQITKKLWEQMQAKKKMKARAKKMIPASMARKPKGKKPMPKARVLEGRKPTREERFRDIPFATTAVDKTQGIPTEGSSAKDMQILAEILKYGAVPPTIGLNKILSEQFAKGGDIPQYGFGGWLKKRITPSKKIKKWAKKATNPAGLYRTLDRWTNPAGAKRWWNKNIKPLGKIKLNDLNPYDNKKAKTVKKAIDPNLGFAKQRFGSGNNIVDLLSSLASGSMEMGGEVPAGRRMYGMGGNTKKKRKK